MTYLSPNLKHYYLEDFRNNVVSIDDPYWYFDRELMDIVADINLLSGLQTLYSKSYSSERFGLDLNPLSYIKIAFSEDMRIPLGKALMQVYDKVNAEASPVILNEEAPQDNRNFQKDSKFAMGCLSNPDYFRLWHFHLAIESKKDKRHQLFWKTLVIAISSLRASIDKEA